MPTVPKSTLVTNENYELVEKQRLAKLRKNLSQESRALRQEALRDRLFDSAQLDKVLDVARSMANLTQKVAKNPSVGMDKEEAAKHKAELDGLKAEASIRLALLSKVLPDQKEVTLEAEDGGLPGLSVTILHKSLPDEVIEHE